MKFTGYRENMEAAAREENNPRLLSSIRSIAHNEETAIGSEAKNLATQFFDARTFSEEFFKVLGEQCFKKETSEALLFRQENLQVVQRFFLPQKIPSRRCRNLSRASTTTTTKWAFMIIKGW